MALMDQRIEVVIKDEWPHLKLLLISPDRIRQETRIFDVALTEFDVLVRNALQQAVNVVVTHHKQRSRG